MKRNIVLSTVIAATLLSLSVVVQAAEPQYFYYFGDDKVPLHTVPNKYLLYTTEEVDISAIDLVKEVIRAPISKENTVGLNVSSDLWREKTFDTYADGYWYLVSSDATKSEFERIESVNYVGTVFAPHTEGKGFYVEYELTNLVNVGFAEINDRAKKFYILEQFAQKNKISIISHCMSDEDGTPIGYILSCDKNSAGDALQIANMLNEMEEFLAVPIFVADESITRMVPTGPSSIIHRRQPVTSGSISFRQSGKALNITMQNKTDISNAQVSLYNLAGKRQNIKPVYGINGTISVSLNNIAAGSYVLMIKEGKNNVSHRVMVR